MDVPSETNRPAEATPAESSTPASASKQQDDNGCLANKNHPPQKILVLCGLVGSGKSTFACELEKYNPNLVRISQDVLGSRPACERQARNCLEQGKSIMIDRQNFDLKQRKTWIKIGREHAIKTGQTDLEIDVIEFATPYEECHKRLQIRTGHETLHSAQDAIGILKLNSKLWVAPALSEGFDRQLILVPRDSPRRGPNSMEIPFPLTEKTIKSFMDRLNIPEFPPKTNEVLSGQN